MRLIGIQLCLPTAINFLKLKLNILCNTYFCIIDSRTNKAESESMFVAVTLTHRHQWMPH